MLCVCISVIFIINNYNQINNKWKKMAVKIKNNVNIRVLFER
jgi:hypothetical protein